MPQIGHGILLTGSIFNVCNRFAIVLPWAEYIYIECSMADGFLAVLARSRISLRKNPDRIFAIGSVYVGACNINFRISLNISFSRT